MGFKDISRLMGDRWKAMPEEAKKEYVELSERDHNRFQMQTMVKKKIEDQINSLGKPHD